MKLGVWLATANTVAIEMAKDLRADFAVLDLEHGIFDPTALDALVGFATAEGVLPIVKAGAPEGRFVMEALDRGAAAVLIPQVRDLGHAQNVTAYAKYPPMGCRGASGGRVFGYKPASASFYRNEDTRKPCYVMIETAGALKDVDAIAALPTVDGLFVGPTDLSLSCGRPAYEQSAADFEDIARIAAAAAANDKPWIFPAWSDVEQRFARDHGASMMVVANEHGALKTGLQAGLDSARQRLIVI
ncbi:aldolase/citrate lyase family protein [Kordiimonas lacus]|uniref:4-hydroxy-2-oxoheptanedioate aldolase n=1 Tax=Kordiimonas lacus TaxID=637679 RepID=A0A1G7EV04_9PROT|nr:aldolase/citrate lyase family protein [Kordiimonas lacus]SDE67417.1 4-hydroxy-2-oxoheptanedioate aldolase [Kordiimonas lacus]